MQPQGPYGPPSPQYPPSGPQGQTGAPLPYGSQPAASNPYAVPPAFAGQTPPLTPINPAVPPPPPRPQSPYDFFMTPDAPKKKSGGLPGNKMLWIAGGGVALIFFILPAFLMAPKGEEKLALVSVARAQAETLRVCTDGAKHAKLQPNKSFAANCQLSMTTELRQLQAQLKKSGTKADDKFLASGRSAAADKELAAGKASSNYDEAFRTVMQRQLETQANRIKAAGSDPTTTAIERQLLKTYADSTALLQKQLERR